jgi:predicted metal-dependent peptidase
LAKNKNNGDAQKINIALKNYSDATRVIGNHPMFSPIRYRTHFIRNERSQCPDDGWAVVTKSGDIHFHPTLRLEVDEWVYVMAHCMLHLGFGHFVEKENPVLWNIACDAYITKFLKDLKLGKPPGDLAYAAPLQVKDEHSLYQQMLLSGVPEELKSLGTGGLNKTDMIFNESKSYDYFYGGPPNWEELLGKGLSQAVLQAVEIASEMQIDTNRNTIGNRARNWFINHYPLLGALAANFTIIEDQTLCHRLDIGVAAIDVEAKEIYLNPSAGLDEEETKFVMAHELLHAGLMHHERRQGRDHYYWNVACDYVINQWLVEMNIGQLPRIGLLLDPEMKGKSSEEIYDFIVTDLRKYRKFYTMRGIGESDIINKNAPNEPPKEWTTVDDFIRNAMSQGLSYHLEQARGFLPAGLIEEIRALDQPPISWDVELARWFDNLFEPLEKTRTYARLSRRQSSTPNIPRPKWVTPTELIQNRTFGVVLDTSGSMDKKLLAKALGTIASYSISRDVPFVRVIFCDAAAYDEGYMSPDEIADKVRVKGRGGTVLQPGIDLLERAKDFPKDGPILVITDGYCERLTIKREHAYILPKGNSLPFVAKGPVFRID